MSSQLQVHGDTAESPSRLEQRKARTRLTILEAATQLFAEKSYAETAMQDVAQEAGVGVGTLYGYFGSKEDLLRAVLRDRWRNAIEAIGHSIDPSAAALDQAVSVIMALARHIRDDRSLLQVAFSIRQAEPTEADEVFAGRMMTEFSHLIERGIADHTIASVPPRATVNVLVSSAIMAMLHLRPWEETDDDVMLADLERITRQLLQP